MVVTLLELFVLLFFFLFVTHLRPVGLNILGYHFPLLEGSHLSYSYGHSRSFLLSPVKAYEVFIAMRVQYSYYTSFKEKSEST